MQAAHGLNNGLFILVAVRLQVRTVRVKVPDVLEALAANRTDAVNGFIRPVPSGENESSWRVIRGEDIAGLHGVGPGNPGQSQSGGGYIDMFDQILADFARGNSGPPHDQRHMDAAVIEELLVANVADPVIGPEED